METPIANSWTGGYILKDVQYWKCNDCGSLQQFQPYHMNYCGCCGLPKVYVYDFHNEIKKEVVE